MSTVRGDRRPVVEFLPPSMPGLARSLPDRHEDVLYVVGDRGGVRVDPHHPDFDAVRHEVLFGRDDTAVRVHLGAGDPEVSRQQGSIFFDGRRWHLRNLGELDLRLPLGSHLENGNEVELPRVWHPVYIDTPRNGLTHVLEIRVTARTIRRTGDPEPPTDGQTTTEEPPEGQRDPSLIKLEDRLAVVAMAQQRLRNTAGAEPLSYNLTAAELRRATGKAWTRRDVENRISRIRERLTREGLLGLRAKEYPRGDALGNKINDTLISILIHRGAITPADLRLLEVRDAGDEVDGDAAP